MSTYTSSLISTWRNADVQSTYINERLRWVFMIRSNLMIVHCTTGANVSTKSTPSICWSPLTQNLFLNLLKDPYGYCFLENALVDPRTFILEVRDTISHAFITSWRELYSIYIASLKPSQSWPFIAWWYVGCSLFLVVTYSNIGSSPSYIPSSGSNSLATKYFNSEESLSDRNPDQSSDYR